ncbi:MAG: hypothetical protein FWE47_04235 [Oscillospiraceae bacterium]|nr:hypothetical protein [Oscillospiraceae bacterium]
MSIHFESKEFSNSKLNEQQSTIVKELLNTAYYLDKSKDPYEKPEEILVRKYAEQGALSAFRKIAKKLCKEELDYIELPLNSASEYCHFGAPVMSDIILISKEQLKILDNKSIRANFNT